MDTPWSRFLLETSDSPRLGASTANSHSSPAAAACSPSISRRRDRVEEDLFAWGQRAHGRPEGQHAHPSTKEERYPEL